jgi:hypothetical protein
MTAALIFRRQLVRHKPDLFTASSELAQDATHESILMFPPPIFRSGVLRQGSDKFYSVSFQARLSLLASSLTPRSPES